MQFDETKSVAWTFIIRNAPTPNFPAPMIPHVDYIVWIAMPQGISGRFLIYGYCYWQHRRNLYVLRTRYCSSAEWRAVDWNDKRPLTRIFNPFNRNAIRYRSGKIPTRGSRKRTLDLPRFGYYRNNQVQDLTGPVDNTPYDRTNPPIDPNMNDLPDEDSDNEFGYLSAEDEDNYTERHDYPDSVIYYRGRVVSGSTNGYFWNADLRMR